MTDDTRRVAIIDEPIAIELNTVALPPDKIQLVIAVGIHESLPLHHKNVDCAATAGVMARQHLRELAQELIAMADNPLMNLVLIDSGVGQSVGVDGYPLVPPSQSKH